MTTSRNRLHQNKLQAFTDFCKSEGWQSVPTKNRGLPKTTLSQLNK